MPGTVLYELISKGEHAKAKAQFQEVIANYKKLTGPKDTVQPTLPSTTQAIP